MLRWGRCHGRSCAPALPRKLCSRSMPNMPANFGTQPARPPFAWLLLPALRAGVSKAGAPMPSGAATPTPPYGTRFLVGPINRAACIPRLSCFSARQPHQSDIWLPLCCLPCCLCARLISFDFLAPSISQSAQCRQVIAHEQHGLHLEPLLRCSSTQGAAGRNLAAHADGARRKSQPLTFSLQVFRRVRNVGRSSLMSSAAFIWNRYFAARPRRARQGATFCARGWGTRRHSPGMRAMGARFG
jgi:hypothetical protein